MGVREELGTALRQSGFVPEGDPVIVTEETIGGLVEAIRPLAAPGIKCLFIGGGDNPFVGEFDGLDGFAEAWSDWLAAFEALELELGSVLLANDACLVIDGRQRGRSALAGVDVVSDAVAVWRYDDEHVTHAEFYLERGTALRAVGLG